MEQPWQSNPSLELAYDYLEYTGENVFLTGKAGTGKTTFLRRLRERSPKRMIVVAPTGVAAMNAGGVTIHSFFQLPFGPYLPGASRVQSSADTSGFRNRFSREKINIIRSIDLLVIDEISMVRADLLDAIDDVLRRYRDRTRPFGGLQLLMIGDMQQLAPVAKEEEWELLRGTYESVYFFHSQVLAQTRFVVIELHQVFRQQHGPFLDILNRIREHRVDEQLLSSLNRRLIPGFRPPAQEGYITLTTHNWQAQKINQERLRELPDPVYAYAAEIKGEFPAYSYPTDESLVLKKGAQVMFVKNDTSSEKAYFNGKIGIIESIGSSHIVVRGKDDEGFISVGREEWTNTRYTIDPESKEITETIEGTFLQYPLKLAWAITIHKSQGLTFDRVVIDPHAAFAHGQVYVALSRCRTLEGLTLSSPVNARSLVPDLFIDRFSQEASTREPDRAQWRSDRIHYFRRMLLEQFDFSSLRRSYQWFYRQASEHLYKLYPEQVKHYREIDDRMRLELEEVAARFRGQIDRLVGASADPETDPLLGERLRRGRDYFAEQLREMCGSCAEACPETDNQQAQKALKKAWEQWVVDYRIKEATLRAMTEGFSLGGYLTAKALVQVEPLPQKKKSKREKPEKSGKTGKPAGAPPVVVSGDILHPDLFEELRRWRREQAETSGMPAYTVLHQRALIGVVNSLPTNAKELLAIPGIGKAIVARHGAVLLEMVDRYRFQQAEKKEAT